MPQNEHMERHRKLHGRRLDHEERERKKAAREVNRISQKAKKLRGIKAKLFNKKRHAEKIQMKKTCVYMPVCFPPSEHLDLIELTQLIGPPLSLFFFRSFWLFSDLQCMRSARAKRRRRPMCQMVPSPHISWTGE